MYMYITFAFNKHSNNPAHMYTFLHTYVATCAFIYVRFCEHAYIRKYIKLLAERNDI